HLQFFSTTRTLHIAIYITPRFVIHRNDRFHLEAELMNWKRLFRSARAQTARRVAQRIQLGVETLEARTVPTASPYLVPANPAVTFQSILTVGDTVNGYRMVGIPDGLGAFDNGNGTFTVLMNHELTNADGITRAHGGKGAFVSEWIIDKNTLQ